MKKAVVMAVVPAALAVVAAWYFLGGRAPEPPDASKATPESVREYLASERFAKLPGDRQAQYIEALMSQPPERVRELMPTDAMPKAERDRLRDNFARGFMRVMVKQAQEYAALAPDKRDAYVDGKMDEMMSRMQAMRAMQPPGGRGAGPPMMGGRMNADEVQRRMEQMLSRTTPQERAALENYQRELMSRMMARMGGGFFR